MEHTQIVKAINFIRPNAKFSLTGTEITWLDENQTEPTKKQIEDGWVAYQAAEKTKAESIAAQKQLVIEKLGLTADEAKLLLS